MNAHGWKMYLAGVLGLLTAANDAFVNGNYSLGVKEAVVALGVLGLSHKLAKIILALTGGKINIDGL